MREHPARAAAEGDVEVAVDDLRHDVVHLVSVVDVGCERCRRRVRQVGGGDHPDRHPPLKLGRLQQRRRRRVRRHGVQRFRVARRRAAAAVVVVVQDAQQISGSRTDCYESVRRRASRRHGGRRGGRVGYDRIGHVARGVRHGERVDLEVSSPTQVPPGQRRDRFVAAVGYHQDRVLEPGRRQCVSVIAFFRRGVVGG